jgi:hypothetical protein
MHTMPSKVTDQHRTAFAFVSAFVILDAKGETVARIAFRHPKAPIGRLYAFVHWHESDMRRGLASGLDFKSDKLTAALANAARQFQPTVSPAEITFWYALSLDGGQDWISELASLGLKVIQAL